MMDIDMPIMDGYESSKLINQFFEEKNIKNKTSIYINTAVHESKIQ